MDQETMSSDLISSRPRSEGWPHRGHTFSIYPCPLSFWLTLPQGVLSTSWCCPSRLCVAFLAFVHLALFLGLSLSPGNSLVSSRCDNEFSGWFFLVDIKRLVLWCCSLGNRKGSLSIEKCPPPNYRQLGVTSERKSLFLNPFYLCIVCAGSLTILSMWPEFQ